jgi:hypothetical protein
MARQIKLKTREVGDLHLMLVRSTGGVWEDEWEPLRDAPWAEYLTRVDKATLDHALHGWTSPLVKALGPSPSMILHRISPDAQQCALWDQCVFYRKRDCTPKAPKMPNCFQPVGVPAELGYEVVRLWRESVYVVIVEEP